MKFNFDQFFPCRIGEFVKDISCHCFFVIIFHDFFIVASSRPFQCMMPIMHTRPLTKVKSQFLYLNWKLYKAAQILKAPGFINVQNRTRTKIRKLWKVSVYFLPRSDLTRRIWYCDRCKILLIRF